MDLKSIEILSSDTKLLALLESNGLPTEDLEGPNKKYFAICQLSGEVVGYGGFEFLGEVALLRSVGMLPEYRGQKLGRKLVEALENIAAESKASEIYLLTIVADGFFVKCGYRYLDRKDAPKEISSTSEFSSVCPGDAHLLVKFL